MKKIVVFCFIVLFVMLILRTVLGQSKDEAIRLYNQGMNSFENGKYYEALKYFANSLEIFKTLNHQKGISANLNTIGRVYESLGQYEKALNYYEESLKMCRKPNILQYIATNLNDIGLVYNYFGKYKKTLNYFEESLKIYRKLNIPQDIAMSLNNIGLVYNSLGQYEKSLNYFEESLKIYRKLNIPQDIAMSLNNIGIVYGSLGLYEKALNYLDESLKIYRELKVPQDIATSLSNTAAVYHFLGQYEKALNYCERSLKIYRKLKIPQYIAISLNNIGLVYDSLGQYEKVLNCHEESLKIRRQLNIPQDIATSLDNIGWFFLKQQEYKKAEEKFYEAEEEKKKLDVKFIGNSYFVELYLATERYNKALSILNEMKPTWRLSAPELIQFHTKKGLALKGRKMFKEASHEFFKAISITEEMRHGIKEKAGFLGAGGSKGRIRSYRGLIAVLSERVIRGEKKDEIFTPYGKDIASSAFYFMESTKARVLLKSMSDSKRQKRKIELQEKLRKKEQNLLNQLSSVESHWEDAYKKGEEVFGELQDRKEKLNTEVNCLIKKLRATHPRYAALYYPKPIPPEELPLRNNEVLIEYALGDDAGYVFIVRQAGVIKLIKIPSGKEVIEEKIKAFMEPLNSNQYWNFSITKAKEIYDILLSEVLKGIKEDEKIIIVPDGILGLLPFDALVIKPGKSVKDSLYVGDKYNLSYYQSASVMAFQRRFKHKKAGKTLFALGNPVFDKEDPRYLAYKQGKPQPTKIAKNAGQYAHRALATRREWGKTGKHDKEGKELTYVTLPETEIEVKAIAKLFGINPVPPNILLNVMANETEFRKVELDKYRYIHFATHADLPGRVQGIQEPFLLLGQVENNGKDDGFLTMSEVLGLKLNADLVVLSACVTGVGKHMEGEGVVSFARAFQYAGGESVIVSLWEVASDEAVEYMKVFYGYLKSGKGRTEALRLARKKIKAEYPNPFYWAVFILHGEE